MYCQTYWRKELEDESMDTNPEAQTRGKGPQRGSSEGRYSTWPQVDNKLQTSIIIAMQLISCGMRDVKCHCVTYSYSPGFETRCKNSDR